MKRKKAPTKEMTREREDGDGGVKAAAGGKVQHRMETMNNFNG